MHSCKVELYGVDYTEQSITGLGYSYIWPFNTELIDDLEVRQRIEAHIAEEGSGVKWAFNENAKLAQKQPQPPKE